ncbi:hypothetical protein GCM10009551_069530 [Nocardiopsis tropica]
MIVRVSPAVPPVTPSESPIGVSSPTGSISEVTTVKVAAATAATAAHPRAGEDGGGGGAAGRPWSDGTGGEGS